ncbi:cytochrome P450 [Psychromicrobium lacuslunae]|uniref:Cytochrome P450 n=1 Tax=Psychromicrobium lacuslunae TaxID=1618207 RepID=A0A0D4C3F9_9MICC|nr:cytochrome P450 [Psychromicrobium lacuslunae]
MAARWESKVQRAAHPLSYPALQAVPGGLLRVPKLGILVKDAQLVREVLKQPETFAKNGPGTSSDLWTPVLGEKVLLNMSGQDHAQLRRKLSPLFAPGFVEALSRKALAPHLATLTQQLASGQAVDLVQKSHLLSSEVISQLVGLPAGQVHDDAFYQQIHRISGSVRLRNLGLSEQQLRQARELMEGLTGAAKSAYQSGDPETIPGRMRELGLSEQEALGAVGAFALTGTETLTAYIPRLIALLIDSGWLPRVAAARQLSEASIAEGLRVTTPVLVMLRHARSAATLGRLRVAPGERLILLGFRINQLSGTFDPQRNSAAELKQLWFGGGVHFCLGAPLAMAQTRLVLDALLNVVSESGPLRISSRQAARRVLIPAYQRLLVTR